MEDVRFARNGDVNLAYRVLGDGPVDVMLVNVWFSNLDLLDLHPVIAAGIDGLSSFARLILWDRRGAGLSDRLVGPATLEEGMDDLIAVLDAAGSERAALMGFNESGSLCMLTAASRPDRISSLILYGTFATTTWQPDYPWGQDIEERDEQVRWVCDQWGTREVAQLMFAGGDESLIRWGQMWTRSAVSRDALPKFYDMIGRTDVRHVLPTIRIPTLVLHRRDDIAVPVDNGRYLADKIPGAKLVELEGAEHTPFMGDWDSIQGEVEEFLTGGRTSGSDDRVLATILFTDIVDSTKRASEVGDSRWTETLGAHDEVAREQIERFGGTLVKNTGDGVLATFDGPQRAIRCARALERSLQRMQLSIRCGIHTGEVELRGADIGGIAVHIAARVLEHADGGELVVSGAVPPLVAGSGLAFGSKGRHVLKGVDGEWELFSVGTRA